MGAVRFTTAQGRASRSHAAPISFLHSVGGILARAAPPRSAALLRRHAGNRRWAHRHSGGASKRKQTHVAYGCRFVVVVVGWMVVLVKDGWCAMSCETARKMEEKIARR